MNPTIAIVIPAYNASQYLRESIESVLNQTFQDFQLLIIDDGSTDDTSGIARGYCQQDSRVKLISQTNQGLSATRNRGIDLTDSKFVTFLDADDIWYSDKLASHITHFHENPNLGISFARVEFLTPDGKQTGQMSKPPLKQLQPHHFLYENPTVTGSNFVVRREVFEKITPFDTNMSYTEDLDFLLRVSCCNSWEIEGINKVLMGYRISESSLSSNLDRMEQGWEFLISKARKHTPELVEQHYLKARSTQLRYLARRALRSNLPSKTAVNYMTRALLSDWKLILREPRRTLLTILAVYGKHLLPI
jgi:glycosyltransferase involved in cell wall biosynthesis